ncbi:MAG: AbiV family abortive infection protein [Saprospiraceae bacterium]|jgi:AbiV family abortive infection protein|nr:AbiV family abortive infection protein [Saprospiraceae bacterium]
MKEFMNLSREDCLKYYSQLLKNAETKFNTAHHVATEIGDYGTAISIHLTGLEELMKALIIFLDGKGYDFRSIAGIKSIFNNHPLRHLLTFFMFVMSVFKESFEDGIAHVRKINLERDVAKINAIKSNRKQLFKENVIPYLMEKLRFIDTEIIWYQNFGKIREFGLYTDFVEGRMMNPVEINDIFYYEVKSRIDRVRAIALGIIRDLETPSNQETDLLPDLIKFLQEEKAYEYFGNLLSQSRKQGVSVLDFFLLKFRPMILYFLAESSNGHEEKLAE